MVSGTPHPHARPGFGSLLLAFLALLLPLQVGAQAEVQEEVRRLMAPEDYAQFENLGAASFSADARFLAVTVSRFDDDGEVRIVPLEGGEPRVIERGTQHTVAPEGPWLAVVVGPGQEERQRLQRENSPVRNDLLLVDLDSGAEVEIARVEGHSFSPDGRFILLRRYAPSGRDGDASGRDVVVRELATGVDVNFGNVSEATWADEGAVLAMVVDAEGMAGNGVRLYDAGAGQLRTLHSEEARFSALTWRDDARDLAVFRADPDEAWGDTVLTVLAWRDAIQGAEEARVLDGSVTWEGGAPEGGAQALRVRATRGITWADDGTRLFVGAQPRDPGATPEEDRDEGEDDEAPRRGGNGPDSVPGLEIWHARDVDPVPQQRVRANMERNRSHLLAWPLEGEAVVLGGGAPGESISLVPGQARAILTDPEPYGQERMFGPIYSDVHEVDVETGARTLRLERVEYLTGSSPGARYLLFFRDDHFHTLEFATGEVRNVTEGIPATFVNEEVDRLTPQKPPYGVGGWTEGDTRVLLYDRYDVWSVRPDGEGGERITEGAEDEVRHRLVRLDPDEDAYPANGPWTVSLYGEWTKASGYGRVTPGGAVERLVWEDRMIGRLMRADDEQTHVYVSQRYDEPPTFHRVGSDFADPTPVLRSNDFVDGFHLGRAELLDFENDWGVPLQAALFYPADYEPGRRYPMIVYHYERRSQVLHGWTNPSDRNAYNTRVFTQNGYFVLQPDIVYRPRNPGLSAMEAILPAVDAALATGHIDEDAIGITGHSWGGYQTTFAVTQTDRFAAAVAGAPLTNLVSMYLSFYWNTGGTDARIFEISQGRMEVPWWEDFESYRANSPVHHIEAMNTPLLMAFGDEDGAVEFNQGVEFYNAARRADRDFVLLVYAGENHSLQQRPNQEDYHRRSLEWFEHYLKGAPAPAWITEGVPYLEQQEKLQRGPTAGRR